MTDENRNDAPQGTQEPPEIIVRDRRFWVVEGEEAGQEAPRQSQFPSFVEELQSRIGELQARLEESARELAAAQAGVAKVREDGEALRKRLTRDLERRVGSAKGEFLLGFLEVLDNFDLAIQSAEGTRNFDALLEGIRMVRELFLHRLAEYGVTPVETKGKEFDPRTSEALGLEDVDDADLDGVVTLVMRPGYLLQGEIFRPAQVRVGRFVLPKPRVEPPAAAPVAKEAMPEVLSPAEEDLHEEAGEEAAEAPGGAAGEPEPADDDIPPLNPAEVEF